VERAEALASRIEGCLCDDERQIVLDLLAEILRLRTALAETEAAKVDARKADRERYMLLALSFKLDRMLTDYEHGYTQSAKDIGAAIRRGEEA